MERSTRSVRLKWVVWVCFIVVLVGVGVVDASTEQSVGGMANRFSSRFHSFRSLGSAREHRRPFPPVWEPLAGAPAAKRDSVNARRATLRYMNSGPRGDSVFFEYDATHVAPVHSLDEDPVIMDVLHDMICAPEGVYLSFPRHREEDLRSRMNDIREGDLIVTGANWGCAVDPGTELDAFADREGWDDELRDGLGREHEGQLFRRVTGPAQSFRVNGGGHAVFLPTSRPLKGSSCFESLRVRLNYFPPVEQPLPEGFLRQTPARDLHGTDMVDQCLVDFSWEYLWGFNYDAQSGQAVAPIPISNIPGVNFTCTDCYAYLKIGFQFVLDVSVWDGLKHFDFTIWGEFGVNVDVELGFLVKYGPRTLFSYKTKDKFLKSVTFTVWVVPVSLHFYGGLGLEGTLREANASLTATTGMGATARVETGIYYFRGSGWHSKEVATSFRYWFHYPQIQSLQYYAKFDIALVPRLTCKIWDTIPLVVEILPYVGVELAPHPSCRPYVPRYQLYWGVNARLTLDKFSVDIGWVSLDFDSNVGLPYAMTFPMLTERNLQCSFCALCLDPSLIGLMDPYAVSTYQEPDLYASYAVRKIKLTNYGDVTDKFQIAIKFCETAPDIGCTPAGILPILYANPVAIWNSTFSYDATLPDQEPGVTLSILVNGVFSSDYMIDIVLSDCVDSCDYSFVRESVSLSVSVINILPVQYGEWAKITSNSSSSFSFQTSIKNLDWASHLRLMTVPEDTDALLYVNPSSFSPPVPLPDEGKHAYSSELGDMQGNNVTIALDWNEVNEDGYLIFFSTICTGDTPGSFFFAVSPYERFESPSFGKIMPLPRMNDGGLVGLSVAVSNGTEFDGFVVTLAWESESSIMIDIVLELNPNEPDAIVRMFSTTVEGLGETLFVSRTEWLEKSNDGQGAINPEGDVYFRGLCDIGACSPLESITFAFGYFVEYELMGVQQSVLVEGGLVYVFVEDVPAKTSAVEVTLNRNDGGSPLEVFYSVYNTEELSLIPLPDTALKKVSEGSFLISTVNLPTPFERIDRLIIGAYREGGVSIGLDVTVKWHVATEAGNDLLDRLLSDAMQYFVCSLFEKIPLGDSPTNITRSMQVTLRGGWSSSGPKPQLNLLASRSNQEPSNSSYDYVGEIVELLDEWIVLLSVPDSDPTFSPGELSSLFFAVQNLGSDLVEYELLPLQNWHVDLRGASDPAALLEEILNLPIFGRLGFQVTLPDEWMGLFVDVIAHLDSDPDIAGASEKWLDDLGALLQSNAPLVMPSLSSAEWSSHKWGSDFLGLLVERPDSPSTGERSLDSSPSSVYFVVQSYGNASFSLKLGELYPPSATLFGNFSTTADVTSGHAVLMVELVNQQYRFADEIGVYENVTRSFLGGFRGADNAPHGWEQVIRPHLLSARIDCVTRLTDYRVRVVVPPSSDDYELYESEQILFTMASNVVVPSAAETPVDGRIVVDQSSSKPLSGWEIFGIVAGSIAGVVLLIVIISTIIFASLAVIVLTIVGLVLGATGLGSAAFRGGVSAGKRRERIAEETDASSDFHDIRRDRRMEAVDAESSSARKGAVAADRAPVWIQPKDTRTEDKRGSTWLQMKEMRPFGKSHFERLLEEEERE